MRKMKGRNVFWGLGCILAAVCLIACKLGFFGGISFLTLLLTLFFAVTLLQGLCKRNYTGVIFSAAFLLILYAKPLGIEMLTPWTILIAAALLSCGLSFLLPKNKRKDWCYQEEWKEHSRQHHGKPEEVVIDMEDDGYIHQITQFGASTKYVNCDDFKQAELKCAFGAMTVYFDKAVVKSGKANVCVQVNFAGMELYVPKEWTIVNKVRSTVGGIDEKNSNYPDGSVTLVLDGKVNFGGVDIIYV